MVAAGSVDGHMAFAGLQTGGQGLSNIKYQWHKQIQRKKKWKNNNKENKKSVSICNQKNAVKNQSV